MLIEDASQVVCLAYYVLSFISHIYDMTSAVGVVREFQHTQCYDLPLDWKSCCMRGRFSRFRDGQMSLKNDEYMYGHINSTLFNYFNYSGLVHHKIVPASHSDNGQHYADVPLANICQKHHEKCI
jgi:hypothetical protein